MRLLLLFSLLFSNTLLSQKEGFSPHNELNAKSTKEALDSVKYSPLVFLGQIANNPANSNLELNLADEKAKLQGVLYRSQGGDILSIDVSGENENQSLAIFNGTKINPKVKGTLMLTVPMKTWVSWSAPKKESDLLDTLVKDSVERIRVASTALFIQKRIQIEERYQKTLLKTGSEGRAQMNRKTDLENHVEDSVHYFNFKLNNLKYDLLLQESRKYNVKRKNYSFLTFGASAEGASYNLFDSLKTTSFITTKENYKGWNFFAQYNIMSYRLEKKRMTVHSFRTDFGEFNNVDELTEYSYTETKTNPSGSQVLERKTTGYIDPYFTQNRAAISYELNYYPMDSTKRQVGFLIGTDFLYFSRVSNQMDFHIGLNFPLLMKGSALKPPFYISAILGTNDTFNWAKNIDFTLKNNFIFTLRFAAPLSFSYLASRKN
jgi:hypothetical protein